jgi:CheY-like chemotaxis protein
MKTHPAIDCPVLVVEDDWELRTILRAFIEYTYNYPVLEANNGQAAIEIARRERPLFVIMDIEMPVLDGLEATRTLRSHPETCDIPVLALSHHLGDKEWRRRALAAGCDDCLDKNVRFELLNHTIDGFARKALSEWKARQESLLVG